MNLTCQCGHELNNPRISHETEYSKWGWFILTVLGLSAKPRLVKYICKDCGKVLKTSNDPETLKKFVGQ